MFLRVDWVGSSVFFSRSANIFQPFLETAEKTAENFENFQPLVGAADERVDFFVK